MIASIRTTYLALSPGGRLVSTFASPDLARAFQAKQAAKGVKLELAVERRTIKPLAMVAEDAPVAKLRGRG